MADELKYEWVTGEEVDRRISDFLFRIDKDMIPRLSDRVNIEDYSKKLAKRAITCFIVTGGEDVASCSLYCDKAEAYISSIAVKKENQNSGIGNLMMKQIKEYAKERGCCEISLKVYIENRRAYSYYLKNGFEVTKRDASWLLMTARLR